MFRKYERVIADAGERKAFVRLLWIRVVLFAAGLSAMAAGCVLAILSAEPVSDARLFLIVGLFFGGAVFEIAALLLHLGIEKRFRRMLARPPAPEEPVETVSYRQKMLVSKKEERKRSGWALAVLIACVAVSLVLLLVDSLKSPESETVETPLFYVSVGVALFGALLYFFVRFFGQAKLAEAGKTFEMQTFAEAEKIDAAQGKPFRYRAEEDPNLQTYRYLFPNPALRAQVEAERKKMSRRNAILCGSGAALGVVACFVFFSGWIFSPCLFGCAFPALMTLVFLLAGLSGLCSRKRLRDLENAQAEKLRTLPEYAKHLEITLLYERHAKTKGWVLYVAIGLSLVVGFVLAALFPAVPISLASVLILWGGLLLNGKFVADLRKKVRPLEREIDEMCKFRDEEIDNGAGK